MTNTLIKASNMIPFFDSDALYPSLSLDIKQSAFVSMIGPESSGKTMWLKSLNGFIPIAQGELALLDHDIRQLDRPDWLSMHKQMSYVGQDTALLSAYTLEENILLPALYHKLANRTELVRRMYTLLDEIGFSNKDALNQLPAFVSPIQNYCAKIVRALMVEPEILFLDDLYAHMAASEVSNLKTFLKQKQSLTGLTIVVTTSHVKEVLEDSTEIIYISPNRIDVFANRQDLVASEDSSIKDYLAENNIH